MTETEQLADVIALSIHAATEPLLLKIAWLEATLSESATRSAEYATRLLQLEQRAPVPGPIGPKGDQGEPGSVGPSGKDGAPGLAGTNGQDGLNGKDGAPGLNGTDGRDGLNGQDGAPGLAGKDGRDGLNGKDGSPGLNGKDGQDGIPGLTGKDGAPGLNGKDGRDGQPGVPGRWGDKGDPGADGVNGLDGKDGRNGLDGQDGLGFEDLRVDFDESKGYSLIFENATQRKVFDLAIPFYAGLWTAKTYPKGANVTVRGALYMALETTKTRPEDGSPESAKAWRLAVKGGKDGKDGKPGPAGKDWEPGDDLK